jgi:hypothetical protein
MDDRFVSRPAPPPASPPVVEHGGRRALDHVPQRELVALSLLLRPEAQPGDGR